MELDGFLDELHDFIAAFRDCGATRQIGDVSAPARVTLFNNDHVFHWRTYLSPACFRMLSSVPGGMSTLGFPDTVTVPGLLGCLN